MEVPATLDELIDEVVPPPHPPSESIASPPTFNRDGKMSREERTKVTGFQRFIEGVGMRAIARELDVTPAYLYKVAKRESWVDRRSHLRLSALLTEGLAPKALEMALAQLHAKLDQRLAELDRICQNVKHPGPQLKAIVAWLTMAGVGKPLEGGGPRTAEVINDFSDRRQVTVVQGPAVNSASTPVLGERQREDE